MARIGLRQLAQSLGVDVSTVSRALRDDERVKPETRARVRDEAQRLGYRPHAAARALRGGRTGRVAVLLSPPQQRFASPVFQELLATMARRLGDVSMSLTVFAAQDRAEEPGIVRSIVEDKLADGIVLGRTLQIDPRIDYLRARDFPFVTFGRTAYEDEHSWVEIDYKEAGMLAVQALAEYKPDKLTIVSATRGQRFADNYVIGAREVADQLSVKVAAEERVDMNEQGGEALALKALQGIHRHAFCCIQDSVAFGFLRAAAQLKKRPGEDFSLFGGQNFPGAEHTAPPLSTFSTRDNHVAQLLTETIIERLNADGTPPRGHVIKPTPLLRQSHILG
ncbi:MAG: LacI family DNA-binding transcriptional regulator [Pseudomonadota bacterium]